MLKETTKNRFLDYFILYTSIISENKEQLERVSKKAKSGEIAIDKKKYLYFANGNSITIINKKNNLEIYITFDQVDGHVYFLKNNLYSFIESDLNASGLGRYFLSNNTSRTAEFDECFRLLCVSKNIIEKGSWYIISKEEFSF